MPNPAHSLEDDQVSSRTSPAVDRVVAILNFFAEHPQQPFTLSQVVKATKVRRATCHLLLVSLTKHRYLFRNQDKSYVLGPSLLAISRRAGEGFSPLDVARQEMRILSDELDVIAAAQFREGDEIVTSEYTVSISHFRTRLPGTSRTSIHPWGAIFLSPLRDADIEESFRRAIPALAKEEIVAERKQIAFARTHGFVFATRPAVTQERRSIRGADPDSGAIVSELRLKTLYPLQFLLAPVMDQSGRVAFALMLSGFKGEHSGKQIEEIAQRLLQACKRVTSFIAG